MVFLGTGGRDLSPAQAAESVFGYAVGCDLTRRDVQARAKAAGMPWALSKGFDQSGPVGLIVPAGEWQPDGDIQIRLDVNGERRQQAVLGDMIWPVAELLARLSQEITLHPGDAVFTGTPAGVSGLKAGDRVRVEIDGLPTLEFEVDLPRYRTRPMSGAFGIAALAAVAVGCAIGAVARFEVSRRIVERFGDAFAWGTLAVNLGGCLLAGAFFVLVDAAASPTWVAFLGIGVLGGYTTVSSFSLETVLMFRRGHSAGAMAYLGASMLGCIAAAGLGAGLAWTLAAG